MKNIRVHSARKEYRKLSGRAAACILVVSLLLRTISMQALAAGDGKEEKTITLNRPFQGLLVPPGIWAHEQEFTTGALCLVLASHPYSEDDYIRDYDKYLQIYAK